MQPKKQLPGLKVTIDQVKHCPEATTPPHKPYQFAYYITIHNHSDIPVTIIGRKWIVENTQGHKLILEGDGVIGQFPRLNPGEQFHYNSYHLIDSDSTAEGAYLAKDDANNPIICRIPKFEMKPSSTASTDNSDR